MNRRAARDTAQVARACVAAMLLGWLSGCGTVAVQPTADGAAEPGAAEQPSAQAPTRSPPQPSSQPTPPARPATVAGAVDGATPASGPGAGTWRIEEAGSALRLRVYRGGTLARLGHNHVIIAALRGTAELTADAVASLDLVTEPADWRIDEPAERDRAGADFESIPDTAAIAGTRSNMLSAALLDADRHPRIGIHGTGGPRSGDSLPLALTLNLQGRSVPLQLTLRVAATDDGWRGHGSARITHAQLGLTPFSALGGALRVEDGLDLDIEVTLRR